MYNPAYIYTPRSAFWNLLMTFCIEYHVKIGKQIIRVHTSHANVFPEGSDCFLHFKNPRWYAKESEEIELERTERQVY
jgi:iron(III) transport system ATP-binding protein